eukprot:gene5496-5489_t
MRTEGSEVPCELASHPGIPSCRTALAEEQREYETRLQLEPACPEWKNATEDRAQRISCLPALDTTGDLSNFEVNDTQDEDEELVVCPNVSCLGGLTRS